MSAYDYMGTTCRRQELKEFMQVWGKVEQEAMFMMSYLNFYFKEGEEIFVRVPKFHRESFFASPIRQS